jgi:SAM-dependent methyltransferase
MLLTPVGKLQPHPRVKKLVTGSGHATFPDLPIAKRVQAGMQKETLAASQQATAEEPFCTVEVGPGNFGDIPLVALLEQGSVTGLDIDEAAMRTAVVPPVLQDRLILLPVDASLYISRFCAALERAFAGGTPSLAKLRSKTFNPIVDKIIASAGEWHLPFEDRSVNFWVANAVLCNFFDLSKIIFDQIVLEKYPLKPFQHYAKKVLDSGKTNEEAIMATLRQLQIAYIQQHFTEIARVLKPGGIALVSAKRKAFRATAFDPQRGTIEVPVGAGSKIENEGEELRHTPDGRPYRILHAPMGQREARPRFGVDHFIYTALAQHSGLKMLDSFLYWFCRDYNPASDTAAVIINEAVVMQKAA